MQKIVFFLSAWVIVSAACTSQRSLEKYTGTGIVFGYGGGYSGQELQYTLTTDGNLRRYDNISRQDTLIVTLSRKKTLSIFEEMDEVMRPGIDFNHPGTEYYFIREVKGNKTFQAMWGARSPKAPEQFTDFYDQLMRLVEEDRK